MEVILDELTPNEFFGHGGIVKLTITNDELAKECDLKKKYTFFEYRAYIKFFKNLYLTYLHNHSDENAYDLYRYVNSCISLQPSIGNSDYVVDLNYDQVKTYEVAKFYYYGDRRESNITPRDPYGIPNVCFSLVDEDDSRWEAYTKQRLDRGFDDSETWNLDATISRFIYPRLKAFVEDVKNIKCYPSGMTFDEWVSILEEMLKGFEILSQDNERTDDEEKLIERTLDLFREHFHNLWT